MSIPAVVHQVWIGPPMPEQYRRWAQSWPAHNPGWEHRLWTEPDLARLEMRNRELYDRAEVEAPRDSIRWRVDIARLEILHQHGGIYADVDTVCLRPLDDLRRHRMFLPQSPNAPQFVTNAVMGAEPGHPFLGRLIAGLPANAAAHRGGRLVDTVGGKYITRQIAEHRPEGVAVLPWWLFAAQSIRDRDRGLPAQPRPEAYTNHVYGNTRRRRR